MNYRTTLITTLLISFSLTTFSPSFAQDKKGEKGKEKKRKREICLTFDELPASKGFGVVDKQAINYLILQALKKHNVKATGFVIGEWVEESYDLLGEWLNQGHALGNLTYSYQDYNGLDAENFINDIRKGAQTLEPMLSGFGQKQRYFRFPYLHYGIDMNSRRAVENYLEASSQIVAHATVVVEDYLYNLTLEKLGKYPDSARYESLMNDYLNHVFDQIERSERMSQTILNRPCKQIIQLRANRLNAVFIEEMLTAMDKMGFEYITLDKALKDPLFVMPQGYYEMQGVSYLDMIIESNPDLLPAE